MPWRMTSMLSTLPYLPLATSASNWARAAGSRPTACGVAWGQVWAWSPRAKRGMSSVRMVRLGGVGNKGSMGGELWGAENVAFFSFQFRQNGLEYTKLIRVLKVGFVVVVATGLAAM